MAQARRACSPRSSRSGSPPTRSSKRSRLRGGRPAPAAAGSARALEHWVIVPENAKTAGNIGFVVLVCALIALVQLKGRWRTVLLVPTVYLAACVWEARLAVEPSVTRQILVGAILIVMMTRARRDCSARGAWRSSDVRRLLELTSARAGLRRAAALSRPRPRRRRGRDRQRHRAQRRGQDDDLQPHHRRLHAHGRATSASPTRASPGCCRTRSRGWASRARSSPCGCSST